MDRRKFLVGASVGAVASLPAPALSQGMRELKMVTTWPDSLPGFATSAERIAQGITTASGNRIRVKVYAAGELVKPFESFDAVSSGVADMYHGAEYYWERQSPAFNFFAAVPFGLTAEEMAAWILFDGAQALWDELSAGFNIKPLMSSSTGAQMGGWFTKEVTGPESYKALRYRMPGLGGEVLRRLGAVVVPLSAGEIVPALQSGAIDASEWAGPWNDMALGLHKVSRYYYYPGFHEPGTALTTGVNIAIWNSLSADDRNLFSAVANAEYTRSLAEFNASNARALDELAQNKAVSIRRFDDSLLRALGRASAEVLAELGNSDPLTRRIYRSYSEFRNRAMRWSELSERGFLNARALSVTPSGKD